MPCHDIIQVDFQQNTSLGMFAKIWDVDTLVSTVLKIGKEDVLFLITDIHFWFLYDFITSYMN